MFDFIRTHKKIMQFLLIILIFPSFVLFGIDGYKRFNEKGLVVAVVNGIEISQEEWDQAHKVEVDRMRASMPNIDVSMFDTPAMRYGVLERMVQSKVLEASVQKSNLQISDKRVAQAISELEPLAAIKKPDGSMDYENVKNPMTVQDLMRHTSGLTSSAALFPTGGLVRKMNGAADFMDKITKLPLVYQPGTVFDYGLSHDVLGAVIEKVSGKSLDVYLRETIWNPLSMNDTGFQVPENKRSRQAYAFKLNPIDNKPQSIPHLLPGVTFECGGGCSLSTVPDYHKLVKCCSMVVSSMDKEF